jgi:hypothetical protein
MKTFSQFQEDSLTVILEQAGKGFAAMTDQDFERWVKANPGAAEKARKVRAEFLKTYNTAKQSSGTQQTPPRGTSTASGQPFNSTGKPGSPGNSQGGYSTPRNPTGNSSSGATPSATSTSTPKPTNKLKNIGTGIARQGAYVGADIAADAAIDQIKNPNTRANVRTAKDFGLGTAALYTNPITSIALGGAGQSSSAPSGSKDVGNYRITKRIDSSGGESGFDRFLATGKDTKGYTYNDPNAEKIMAYRRDRVGSKAPEDKPIRIGAAKVGGQVVPVQYGSVAGEKKVGTQAQAASTRAVQQSRQVAAKSNTYGATSGSGIRGIGGPTTVSKTDRGSFISTGSGAQRKTAQLASTQLIRDPKSGKQVVGDLAFKGGQATYLSRPSTASRDSNATPGGAWRNVQRSLNLGGQRERDAAASKREYRTALQNTQQYTKKLGITPQSAAKQKLPGYGKA